MNNLKLFILFLNITFSLTSLYSQELNPEQIFDKVNVSVVVVISYDYTGKQIGQGSGVVFDNSGYVVTNFHVLGDGNNLAIKHYDKTINDISVVGMNIEKDVLVLKIPSNIIPAIMIADTTKLKPGQRVYAVGSPLGLENSITEGIISGLRYSDDLGREFIQISASISPGSSGGAVVNSNGELIGISTFTFKGGQNLNFAIKVSDFQKLTTNSLTIKEAQTNNLFYKGYRAYENSDYNFAIKCYSEYLHNKPNDSKAFFNRGLAFAQIQNYSKAISDYTKAIELDTDFFDAYINRAAILSVLSEYSKALSDLSFAIEIYPNNPDAYFYRGLIYSDSKQFLNSLSDFNKAIELNPAYAKAYNHRGFAYKYLNKYSEAINDYNKAIDIDPKYAEAYNNRGIIYFSMKEYSKSIEDNSKAIEIFPNFAKAFINRGMAYYYSKNNSKACSDWREAQSLGLSEATELLNNYCK